MGDLHGVGAPRGDHFAARPDESAFYFGRVYGSCLAKEPAEWGAFILGQGVVYFNGIDRSGG